MPPCIVIAVFTPSDAYMADRNVTKESLDMVSAIDGVLLNVHGIAEEDPKVGFNIQIATGPEAFIAAVSNKEMFDEIVKKSEVSRVGGFEQYCVVTISDPWAAFAEPVTEITVADLKEPTPENVAMFEELAAGVNKLTDGKFTYGWSGEEKKKAVMVAACESAAVHDGTVQELFNMVETNGGPYHVKMLKNVVST